MKKELQVKFLNFLNNRKQDGEKGFTLIELLVVIIIIGILAAIALPSLLAQANKAKQSEARQNTGAAMRAQQGYYVENGGFSTEVSNLGLGIQSATANFSYVTVGVGTASTPVSGRDQTYPAVAANALGGGTGGTKSLKQYVGILATQVQGLNNEATTFGKLCESGAPQATAIPAASAVGNAALRSQPSAAPTDADCAKLPAAVTPNPTLQWKDLAF